MLGFLERETGIEPATNSLEGCDSTIELLPLLIVVNHLHCTLLETNGPEWGAMAPIYIKVA